MAMKRSKRVGISLLVCMSVLLLVAPNHVAAEKTGLALTINDAFYGDLDGDSLEDDVTILITITLGNDMKSPGKSDVYYTLTLPSGYQHLALVTVIGKYREIRLVLSWFDSAWESGWYNIKVDALIYGAPGIAYDADIYDFDPPGTGNGDPTIKVSFW